jgi:hypothetical protein
MTGTGPGQCLTLWIGPGLGRLERACLRSVLRQGHQVALYCYRPIANVPAGVEVRDAAQILPEDRIIRHRGGSVALFANWFRYELLRRGLGTWVDLDFYLLKPLPMETPCLFGWQQGGAVNNAVLRLPAESEILAELLAIFAEREVPFWLSPAQRLAARARLLLSGRTGVSHMPWGSAGPHALTALARRHRKLDEALPAAAFHPVHHDEADWLRDPSRPLDAMIAPDTIGVHLWNEKIKAWKEAPAPPGSFLARLHEEGA